jgi:hypothetical protein
LQAAVFFDNVGDTSFMSEQKDEASKGYTKGVDKVRAEVLSAILQEHDIFTAQRAKRVELLKKMETHSDPKLPQGRVSCVLVL